MEVHQDEGGLDFRLDEGCCILGLNHWV
jgi:hypothetical protein